MEEIGSKSVNKTVGSTATEQEGNGSAIYIPLTEIRLVCSEACACPEPK
jgi:hypothetical protein